MAGAGTVALELMDQIESLDALLVPCGGGGLTAATAIVMQALSPKTKVYAVEPELFDDTRRSLQAGKRLSNPKGRKTICDAIMTDTPGALTFPINQKLLAGVLTVSDDDVRCAMAFAFEHYKIVVEPGAAVGLAAVLSQKIDTRDKTIGVIATGGNVDATDFCAAVNAVAE
jgi:threonine dehydratase